MDEICISSWYNAPFPGHTTGEVITLSKDKQSKNNQNKQNTQNRSNQNSQNGQNNTQN